MRKCLKITLTGTFAKDFVHDVIQHHARELQLEGTAQQVIPSQIRIILCGMQDLLDSFLDVLHAGSASWHIDDIEIEPFLHEKDYRGVFRVIE